ncbi:MAG: hypothetical protein JWR11_6117 [Mycobacterium sp.]|nr:hypothetical protein [Mycobacterium sp.]
MTLAFITTVRHPHNASDYARVESLLRDTLASITRQTCDDYVVIVVGNRRPEYSLPPRTHFVEVDYAAPSSMRGARTGLAPSIWDKGTKTGAGLIAARDLGADDVMLVDADDFVHRGIAEFVRDHRGHPGWFVKRGLMYSQRRNSYALRRNLFRICGTSFIVPLSAFDVPADLTVAAPQQVIADVFDDYLEDVLGNHRYSLEWWEARGRTLDPLPFTAAVYHVDTGENHSGSELIGPAMPYRTRLAEEFGIRPSKGSGATMWSALGPAALKPDLRPRRPFFMKPPADLMSSYRPPPQECPTSALDR